VAGGGPGLTFQRGTWTCDVRAIWLQALSSPPRAPWGGGGQRYGLELDARGQWRVFDRIELGAELDTLLPSDYFARGRVGYRALGLMAFTYER
jgi:hypothetical protein